MDGSQYRVVVNYYYYCTVLCLGCLVTTLKVELQKISNEREINQRQLKKLFGPIVNFHVGKKVYAKKFLNTIVQYGIKQQLLLYK